MTVTGEGLRIELLETEVSTFFESGNSQPSRARTGTLPRSNCECPKIPITLRTGGCRLSSSIVERRRREVKMTCPDATWL